MRKPVMIVLLAQACIAAGCSSGGNPAPREQLDGQPIMSSRGRLPTEPYSPVDQGGRIPTYDAVIPRERNGAPRSDGPPSPAAQRALDQVVPPLAQPFDNSGATTAPSTRTVSPGTYQTIGGVVAEVNSQAIYSDKIISDIEPDLAAKARDYDADAFEKYATNEITKQVGVAINRELLYAAADRLLDEKDKKQAHYAAEIWRQQQITEAGGSIETTRRRFEQEGRSFDTELWEQYRLRLVQLLLHRKIFPQTQVTAAEMRQFYDANRDKIFTVRDAARFEMIQVDPAKVGGRDIAKQRIEEYRAWSRDGRDFNELAKFSNGPRMRNSEGELPWIDRGAFNFTAVENAVWKTQAGDVTEVVEEGGKFYIAKVEQKRLGRVKPFEEEATQTEIAETLRRQKFTPLYDAMLKDLRQRAIVRSEPSMLQSALDIAMQRYPQWSGK